MIAWALIALGTAPAVLETVVTPGETTLAAVARRALGDERAASELRALNQLTSDGVRPGDRLKLPGPMRKAAVTAIESARSAVARAEAPQTIAEGQRLIADAEAHLRAARYEQAAQVADDAWKYAAQRQPARGSTFQVSVDDSGATRVRTTQGEPVTVQGEGVSREVQEGEVATVERGRAPQVAVPAVPVAQAEQTAGPALAGTGSPGASPPGTAEGQSAIDPRPEATLDATLARAGATRTASAPARGGGAGATDPRAQGSRTASAPGRGPPARPVDVTPPPAAGVAAALPIPRILAPEPGAQLRVSGARGATLRWEPVKGAEGYELSVRPVGPAGPARTLWVPGPPARLDLPAGRYEWTVKARGGGRSSRASPVRAFQVEREN